MKLACSSADLSRQLEAGTLTQLEWLDWCAAELAADGVVFDLRHFPRTDADYLAQLKKLCVDLGLTVAAVAGDGFFDEDGQALAAALAVALALGAPLAIARAPLASDDPAAYGRLTVAAKSAARAAKRSNVTLALRNAPGTLCPSAADCKQLTKDVDSAWLRFAPDIAALDPPEPVDGFLRRAAIAVHALGPQDDYAALVRALADVRAFLVLEPAGASDPQAALRSAVTGLRRAAAELLIERSATRA